MTVCRIRFGRDSLAADTYEWVMLGPDGAQTDSGTAPGRRPPAGTSCDLVIASELVLLESIPAPAARQRRIASALRFLVEDSVISDPERLHVAAGPVSASDRLPVAIIDRQWLQQALALLEGTGLAARHAYPECLLPERAPRTWTIVWTGKNGFARTGDLEGFALDAGESGAPPVSLHLALEQARASANLPERLLVRTVPGANPPPLEQWAAKLGVSIAAGPDWRWSGAGNGPAIDLLQGEFAPRVTERNWTRVLRRPAMLAAALVILCGLGATLDWALKARERSELLGQMAGSYRRSFGENAAVVDAPLQMARALDQLRRQSGEFAAGDFVPLFAAVAERLLDPARHRLETIDYSDGVLSLSVRPVEAAQFSTLFNEMRANASIPGIDVKIEPAESSGKFSLRAVAVLGGRK